MPCETAIGSPRTKVPPATTLSKPQNVLVCVDPTPRPRVAVRYACRHAMKTGGNVSLLQIIEPPEFQHWNAVDGVMAAEHRAIRHPSAVIDSDRYGRGRAAARVAPTLDRQAGP